MQKGRLRCKTKTRLISITVRPHRQEGILSLVSDGRGLRFGEDHEMSANS